jgi:NADH-quinone oxidoreductase subunit M
MLLGVIGILYGAKLAFAQTDLKRLVAYTSVSHMGFVILGVFSFNELAYQGVVIQMIAHGISTGALFILVGQLYERIHTRDINKMGGLWEKAPVMGAIGLIFSMASLGLPGLGNFIAELLILIGAFKANILMSCLASLGLIAATIYSLRIVQKVFLGNKNTDWKMNDLNLREQVVTALLVVAIVWLGLFPQPVLNTAKPALIKTLSKQKEITFRISTPQSRLGGTNTLPLSIFHFESVSILPSIAGQSVGHQFKLSYGQRISPPLGGMGGGNSRFMDFINN